MSKKIKEVNLGDIPDDFNWDDIDNIIFKSAEPPEEMRELTQRINDSNNIDDSHQYFAPPIEFTKTNQSNDRNETSNTQITPKPISTSKKNIVLLNEEYSQHSLDGEKESYNAFELFNLNIKEVPKLVEPFFQKVGLASLVGTSDTGKSTFLRQLALSIVLKKETFLEFKLNINHGKVIYVSTEDGVHSVGNSIKKQITQIKDDKADLSLLKNLKFIFNTDKLYLKLTKLMAEESIDLIVIDAFTDVFSKELNSNTQVRNFLNHYDNLAKKNNCLIIFLHHTGKRTQHNSPSKDSILGSQGFEAKMRSVVELKPNKKNTHQKDLWILKSNFLEASEKKKSYILNFSKDMVFSNSSHRGSILTNSKSNNIQLINKVLELHNNSYSFRRIEETLKGTEFEISKTAANEIVKKHKKGGD
jgi:hypothetical protein